MNHDLVKEDAIRFAENFPLKEDLRGKRFCITGTTGLIGSTLTRCLLALSDDIKVTLPVRNPQKAEALFGLDVSRLDIRLADDLVEWTKKLDEDFDFIIHCASPTSGAFMCEHPLETYDFTYQTTLHLLKFAKEHDVKGFVYVSSLEYYGQIFNEDKVTEDMQGYIDATSPRSSYPLAKRAAEYLCTAFAKEYGVPAKIARLTQTFGAGVAKDDNRVFAQFARSIISKSDIILHTKGESSKPYCYTTDAVSAILYILLQGKDGEAYNVANESTYISIRDMAQFLCDNFNPSVNVRIEEHPEMGYAPVTKLNLSTVKLRELGWTPRYDLKEMFDVLIKSL